jgi:hypothetical protein
MIDDKRINEMAQKAVKNGWTAQIAMRDGGVVEHEIPWMAKHVDERIQVLKPSKSIVVPKVASRG